MKLKKSASSLLHTPKGFFELQAQEIIIDILFRHFLDFSVIVCLPWTPISVWPRTRTLCVQAKETFSVIKSSNQWHQTLFWPWQMSVQMNKYFQSTWIYNKRLRISPTCNGLIPHCTVSSSGRTIMYGEIEGP